MMEKTGVPGEKTQTCANEAENFFQQRSATDWDSDLHSEWPCDLQSWHFSSLCQCQGSLLQMKQIHEKFHH